MKKHYVLEVLTDRETTGCVSIEYKQMYYLIYSVDINQIINETKQAFASNDKLQRQTISLYTQDDLGRRDVIMSYRIIYRNYSGIYAYLSSWSNYKQIYDIDNPVKIMSNKKETIETSLFHVLELLGIGITKYLHECNDI